MSAPQSRGVGDVDAGAVNRAREERRIRLSGWSADHGGRQQDRHDGQHHSVYSSRELTNGERHRESPGDVAGGYQEDQKTVEGAHFTYGSESAAGSHSPTPQSHGRICTSRTQRTELRVHPNASTTEAIALGRPDSTDLD